MTLKIYQQRAVESKVKQSLKKCNLELTHAHMTSAVLCALRAGMFVPILTLYCQIVDS